MKRVMFFCIFLLFYCYSFTGVAQDAIFIKATFNGFHCDGKQGLCAMERSSDQVNGMVRFESPDRLCWEIPLSALSEVDHFNLFGVAKRRSREQQPLFLTFPEGYEFPLALQGATPILIKGGRYLVQRKNERYRIELNIK